MKLNMKLSEVIRTLVDMATADDGGHYFEIVHAIALIFPASHVDQLQQLVKGPVWDGNITSKSNRSDLFDMNLAIRVCCKGEQGYTGATYTAHTLIEKIAELA